MAKRKIIWSKKANIKLFEILDFYTKRNKNVKYSTKLYKRFIQEITLLNKYPEMVIMTDYDSIRGLIVDDFILFYEVTKEYIFIHTVWDCRQNPKDLKIN
jgi:hypothetical protein